MKYKPFHFSFDRFWWYHHALLGRYTYPLHITFKPTYKEHSRYYTGFSEVTYEKYKNTKFRQALWMRDKKTGEYVPCYWQEEVYDDNSYYLDHIHSYKDKMKRKSEKALKQATAEAKERGTGTAIGGTKGWYKYAKAKNYWRVPPKFLVKYWRIKTFLHKALLSCKYGWIHFMNKREE